jgi:hypothetical protein
MNLFLLILFTTWYCMIGNSLYSQTNDLIFHQNKDKLNFQYHFNVLDSVAFLNKSDTIACCFNSIYFMETNTKINGEISGNYFGKLFFTKNDLLKWHAWYNNKFSIP